MGSGSRSLLTALACLAVAAAAGFLAGWLLRPEAERVVVYLDRAAGADRSSTDPAAGGGDAAASRAPARARARDPAATAPGTVDTGPIPAPEPASTPLVPASIRVTVIAPEGGKVEGGTVYALSPGEEGTDDGENVCNADVGEDGTALLRLPGAGVYDIGFTGHRGTALAPDVRVPPGDGATLTIHLPGNLVVHASCIAGWPPSPGAQLVVRLLSEKEPGGLDFPGRGCAGSVGVDFEVGPDGAGNSPPLPPGRSFEVAATVQEVLPRFTAPTEEARRAVALQDSCRFSAEPDHEKVRPGETVRFQILPRAVLLVNVCWDRTGEQAAGNPDDKAWPDGRGVQLDSIQADVKSRAALKGSRWVHVPPSRLMIHGEAGPLRLEWSGNGFRAGSREDLVLRAGEVVECTVTFQVDPAGRERPPSWPEEEVAAEEPPPKLEPLRVKVEGLPPGREGRVYGIVPDRDGNGHSSYDLTTEAETGSCEFEGEVRGAPCLAAVAFPNLASDPTPVPAAGPLKLVLRPAGLLLVAPDEVYPPEFGRLRLRLPGKRLIPESEDGGTNFGGAAPEVSVVAGSLVGPLPEGTYAFEVRLGGVRLPDATATVRAGKVEVLRIRR